MENYFNIKGVIVFDPENKTEKHRKQGVWKKVAMIKFTGGLCGYYQWFIKKRYNLPLSTPLRGPHITFINDAVTDMDDNGSGWGDLKKKWSNKEVTVSLSVDVRSNGLDWWLYVPEESRGEIHNIRKELGLGRPYFGLHMTIGSAINSQDRKNTLNDGVINVKRLNEDHSTYIHSLLIKGFIK